MIYYHVAMLIYNAIAAMIYYTVAFVLYLYVAVLIAIGYVVVIAQHGGKVARLALIVARIWIKREVLRLVVRFLDMLDVSPSP